MEAPTQLMTRKAKLKPPADGRQKATNAHKEPKPRKCDDELTTLAETMRPAHRRFAEGIIAGQTGARAAAAAGFSSTSARSIAHRLLRREDVRRYIRLAQRELAVAARVNLPALIDRLWRTVTDENAQVRAKEQALRHLVRILTHRGGIGDAGDDEDDDDMGLTAGKVAIIEAEILGVRRK